MLYPVLLQFACDAHIFTFTVQMIFLFLFSFQHTDEEIERSYEEFYEDVHTEFLKFGEIVNFKVLVCFPVLQ